MPSPNDNGRVVGTVNPDPIRRLEALSKQFPAAAKKKMGDTIPRARKVDPSEVGALHFRGFFKGDLKTGRLGVMEITLQIPYEYRDRAMTLLELAAYPVEIYIEPTGPRQ